MYDQAIKNIINQGLSEQISVHFGPIEEYRTTKMYDLIFVDAAKAQYPRYLEQFLPNLKDEGAMVFDNMVFHGLIYEVEKIGNRNTRCVIDDQIGTADGTGSLDQIGPVIVTEVTRSKNLGIDS